MNCSYNGLEMGGECFGSQEVSNFIENWGKYLEENQLKLLEYFSSNIYGFKLESYEQSRGLKHTVVFTFIHVGVKGQITITFNSSFKRIEHGRESN